MKVIKSHLLINQRGDGVKHGRRIYDNNDKYIGDFSGFQVDEEGKTWVVLRTNLDDRRHRLKDAKSWQTKGESVTLSLTDIRATIIDYLGWKPEDAESFIMVIEQNMSSEAWSDASDMIPF